MKANSKTLAIGAVVAAFLFLFLWEQVQATRLGYDAGRVRADLRERRGRIAYLRLELERLEAPERLAEEARRRLGMSPGTPESLVFLGSDVPRLEREAPKPPAQPKPLVASLPRD